MEKWIGLWLLGLGAAACDESAPPAEKGFDSPPLADLVAKAEAAGRANGSEPYVRPARVDVPAVKAPDLSALPKDAQGRPILSELFGVRLTVNTDKKDAISAMARCLDRVISCVEPRTKPDRRSRDACWAYVPQCQTKEPWHEVEACCPARCVELHERLRTLGYSQLDAGALTADSDCFNGLREQRAGQR